MHLDKERVIVAIQPDVNQVQVVARRFALGPQAVARAAPKSNLLCIYCLLISLFVHEPKHQHVFRYGVLDDGRHEASHFIEIYLYHGLLNIKV